LLVFKLGATARLPEFRYTLAPLMVPRDTWSDAHVSEGKRLWGLYCAQCHGVGTLSAGVLPDLKRSTFLANRDAWRSVVLDGALQDKGMAGFSGFVNAEQVESLRAYVGTRAAAAKVRQE
jgi:mono/diheme cytochrome c family protein